MQFIQNNRRFNWILSILYSAFLPTFNVLNYSKLWTEAHYAGALRTWSVTFLFLMISWHTNTWLTNRFRKRAHALHPVTRIILVLLLNALLLGLFILLGAYVLRESDSIVRREGINLWLITFKGAVSIILIYIVQFALNSYTRAQEYTLQNQMLKMENLQSQFEILRQQVNPHFLFNSLSTLRTMVRAGDPKAEEFVLKLSEIYRQLLVKQQKNLVTLGEELEFVNDYYFMLSSRFGDMLKLTIDLPEELKVLKLPTFSLQMLIENCIKHNVISSDKNLEIKVYNTSPDSITVENHLQPKLTRDEPSGYGLSNLVQRYELLGVSDGVFVYKDEEIFRVKLNLLG